MDLSLIVSDESSPNLSPLSIPESSIKFIALDLDDTLGYFGSIQDAYNIYLAANKDDSSFIYDRRILKIFWKHFRNSFRIGLKPFIQKLNQLYLEEQIYGVCLYTSAANTYRWIEFIVNLIEYGTIGTIRKLFKFIISREDSFERASCGATIKDLKLIPEKLNRYLEDNIFEYSDKNLEILKKLE